MTCSKKIFLTGATGLIGKECLPALTAAGFCVYAVAREENPPLQTGVTWLKGNVFDEAFIREAMERIRPTHLLNLAWCANGDYAYSNANFAFLRAGLSMLESFADNGGKRAVFAGTYMEYAQKDGALKESDPLMSDTCYSLCKNALRETAEVFCKLNNISFAWGRIFCVYGCREHPKRLTASIIHTLKVGQPVEVRHSQLKRDYIYSKDIASAFTRLLDTDVSGCVNICSGRVISLADYARTLAKLLGREDLLVLKEEPASQPSLVLGDNTRLREEVGFCPQYSLEDGLKEILEKLA